MYYKIEQKTMNNMELTNLSNNYSNSFEVTKKIDIKKKSEEELFPQEEYTNQKYQKRTITKV
jgi:hypothetical protein